MATIVFATNGNDNTDNPSQIFTNETQNVFLKDSIDDNDNKIEIIPESTDLTSQQDNESLTTQDSSENINNVTNTTTNNETEIRIHPITGEIAFSDVIEKHERIGISEVLDN